MPSSLMPAPPRLKQHRSVRRVHGPPRLPPELYRLIISHITSKRTLYALLFVSKDWFYEAEPVLYHTIRMVQRGFTTRVKLFHRLIECPRVALYVRSFTVVHDIRKEEVRRGSEEGRDLIPAEQYWLPMNYALRLMDNLQHLHLMLYSYKIEERPFSPLLGCSFQLKSCTLIGADDRERRPLEVQKKLEELELRDGADIIHHRPPLGRLALPKDALPNLEVVTFGGSQGLHRIRPALRAKRMLLKEPLVRTDKIYDKTRSLFFDMEQGGMDSLRCFPGLRFLRMNVVNEPLDYFPALLALYCPQIEKLHIHGTIVPTPIAASAHGPLKIPKISISSLIERLFDAIPSLSTIVMHVNDMVECTEWVRDRFEPRPREWECVAQCGEWREEKWGWGVGERAERAERAERELQEQQERERATEQEDFAVNGPNGSSEEIVGALGLSLGAMVRSDTDLVTGSLGNFAGVGAGGKRPGWTRLGPTAGASSATLPPPSSFPSAWTGAESAPDEFGTVRPRPVPGRAGLSRSASARDPTNSSRDPAGLSRSASSRNRNGGGAEQHPPISAGLARLAGVLARVASTSRIGSGRDSERGSRYEGGESHRRSRAGSRDRDGGISSSGEDGVGLLRVRGGLSRQPSSASFRGDKDRSSRVVENDGVGVSSRAPSRSGSRADLRAAARAGTSGDKSHPPVSGTGARLERNRSTTSRRAGERTVHRDDRDRDRGDRGAGGAGSRAGGAGAFGSFGRKASAMF